MNREASGWDQKLKLGRGFLITLLLVGPVVLWFTWPMLKDEPSLFPGSTIIAGGLLYPFGASLVVYVFLKMLYLLFFTREVSRAQFCALVIALIFLAMILFVARKIAGDSPDPFLVGGGLLALPGGLLAILALGIYNYAAKNKRRP